jgi:hypothetical protein
MKKYNSSSRPSVNCFALLFDYVVFLLSPEDSTESALPPVNRRRTARFDTRFHGAMKIFFWIGFAVCFWFGLLFFFRMLL